LLTGQGAKIFAAGLLGLSGKCALASILLATIAAFAAVAGREDTGFGRLASAFSQCVWWG